MKRLSLALLCLCLAGCMRCGCSLFPPEVKWQQVNPLVRPAAVPSGLGIQLPDRFTEVDLIAIAGVRPGIIRANLDWAGLEPSTESYDLSRLDTVVEFCRASSATLILTLGKGNRIYDGIYPYATDKARDQYLATVGMVAWHFRYDPIIYEVWDDPVMPENWPPIGAMPADYMKLTVATVAVLRQLNPTVCIIGPVSADPAWNQELYSLGFLRLVDGVSLPAGADVSAERLAICEELGKATPIIITRGQASDPTAYLSNLSEGIPVTVYEKADSGLVRLTRELRSLFYLRASTTGADGTRVYFSDGRRTVAVNCNPGAGVPMYERLQGDTP